MVELPKKRKFERYTKAVCTKVEPGVANEFNAYCEERGWGVSGALRYVIYQMLGRELPPEEMEGVDLTSSPPTQSSDRQ